MYVKEVNFVYWKYIVNSKIHLSAKAGVPAYYRPDEQNMGDLF